MKTFLISCLFFFPLLVQAQEYNPACFCVSTARQYIATVPKLDAEYWYLLPLSTHSVPSLGSVVLLQYEDVWHVAVIEGFTATGFKIVEGNYERCKVTRRVLDFDDKHIVNFFTF